MPATSIATAVNAETLQSENSVVKNPTEVAAPNTAPELVVVEDINTS